MNHRPLQIVLGLALVVCGVLLPHSWYTPLPATEPLPLPPLDGMTLLQLSFVLEGVLLVALGALGWHFRPVPDMQRLRISTPALADTLAHRTAIWLLAAISVLALVLRLIGLNSDLWIDEIAPLVAYAHASLWQIFITYGGSNHHLLNTLLVKIFVDALGEHEWVVRLPAVLFGTATIPALYGVARQVMSRRSGLLAALLLAVSYHHIFFSQNARGYSAYLFFSLVSSALLVRALRAERARDWMLFIITTVLNVASQLIGAFVFAAHSIVAALALLDVMRRRSSPLPLLTRVVVMFALAGLLVFQTYAAVLPQMYAIMKTVYADPAAGYAPLSLEFFAELLRGIAAGFSPNVLIAALPLLIVGGIAALVGFVTLLRHNWALMLALCLPIVVHMVFLTAQNLVFSPRFFLLALPVAIIAAVQGLDALLAFASATFARGQSPDTTVRRSLLPVLVALLCIASLLSLIPYYTIPKQPYSSSLTYVQSVRQSDDVVLVIHLAEAGYRYYGKQFNIAEGSNYFYVRSLSAFNDVLATHPQQRALLVTTFPRALHIDYPNLYARIDQGWMRLRTFPATIGDGEIAVWAPRPS